MIPCSLPISRCVLSNSSLLKKNVREYFKVANSRFPFFHILDLDVQVQFGTRMQSILVILFGCVGLLLVLLSRLIFMVSIVKSDSMRPTLNRGDLVIAHLNFEPQLQDIVFVQVSFLATQLFKVHSFFAR